MKREVHTADDPEKTVESAEGECPTMIIMVGGRPLWCCDLCFAPFLQGHVVYSAESFRGHHPSPKLVCTDRCAQKAEQSLTVEPIKRMAWPEFLKALTRGRRVVPWMARSVTEAIAHLRAEGRPVNVRSVRALTGGSNRDVVPLVRQFKALLNEEEAAEMEADLLEAEDARWRPSRRRWMSLPPWSANWPAPKLAWTRRTAPCMSCSCASSRCRLGCVRSEPSPRQSIRIPTRSGTSAGPGCASGGTGHGPARGQGPRRLLPNRRQEAIARKIEWETLRQRAYDLSQAMPDLERAQTDAYTELRRRQVEAETLVHIGEGLVQQREPALATNPGRVAAPAGCVLMGNRPQRAPPGRSPLAMGIRTFSGPPCPGQDCASGALRLVCTSATVRCRRRPGGVAGEDTMEMVDPAWRVDGSMRRARPRIYAGGGSIDCD